MSTAPGALSLPPREDVKLLTLVVVIERGPGGVRVLLGRKKRGFGEGYWNGFGGKVEPGETVEDGARRELLEECGLTATALARAGTLTFAFDDQPMPWEVHVFVVTAWEGEAVETDEMAPAWFEQDALPYDRMWADDPFWYPLLFRGALFEGDFCFKNTHTLSGMDLREVERLKALPPARG